VKSITTLISCLALLTVVACTKGTDVSKVELKTDKDKTLYAMGTMLGSNLQRLNLNDAEIDALFKGLKHAATGQKAEVDMATYQPKIQGLFKERMKVVTDKEKNKGGDFVKKFLGESGANKTDSGLAYKVIKEGTGSKPGPEDTVEVHYHGTLVDGTVFDSSVQRGKTISFPLNRVIKGWTEGLQLMKEGGKTKFVIPSELAYGDAGAPPKIPGGATLVFEVELFKVTKAGKEAKKKGKKK
jgi:FKBP-type peptidyl-prolyl cis-trans isomerase FkpA